MKFFLTLAFMMLYPFAAYAQNGLDDFFADLPRDVMVQDTECTMDGRIVAPLRLDSFHIKQSQQGIWNVRLVVGREAATMNFSAQEGRYSVTQASGEKRLDADFYRGPDLTLRYAGSRLELIQITGVFGPQGEASLLFCRYR